MSHTYEASISEYNPDQPMWQATVNDQNIHVDIPEEFDGSGHGASPEHIYAASLLNCYIATLRVVTEKSGETIERLDASITVTLDPEADVPISDATITLSVEGPRDDRIDMLTSKAEEHCYIHHSVKTRVTVDVEHE